MQDDEYSASVQAAVDDVTFKKPVSLRVEDTLSQRVISVDDALDRLWGFVDTSEDSETQRGVRVLVGTDVNRFAPPSTAPLDMGQTESLVEQAESIIPKVSLRGLFGLSPFERDFYQIYPESTVHDSAHSAAFMILRGHLHAQALSARPG